MIFFYDIPDVIEDLLREKLDAGVCRLDDRWLDIGRLADYNRVDLEFQHAFAGDE